MQGVVNDADKGQVYHTARSILSLIFLRYPDIPKDRYKVTHPVLLVTALRDPIALPSMAKAASAAWCTILTVRELDTGHWVMLEKPDELNATIDEYLRELKA